MSALFCPTIGPHFLLLRLTCLNLGTQALQSPICFSNTVLRIGFCHPPWCRQKHKRAATRKLTRRSFPYGRTSTGVSEPHSLRCHFQEPSQIESVHDGPGMGARAGLENREGTLTFGLCRDVCWTLGKPCSERGRNVRNSALHQSSHGVFLCARVTVVVRWSLMHFCWVCDSAARGGRVFCQRRSSTMSGRNCP